MSMTFRGQPVKIGAIIPGLIPSVFCKTKDEGWRGYFKYDTMTAKIIYIHPKNHYLIVLFQFYRKKKLVGAFRESYCIRGGQVWEE